MSDIAEFLRARLDEDYEAVRRVLGVNVMAAIRHGESAPPWVPSPKGDAGVWDTNGVPRVKFVWARERDHIIRHDPARVLVEVEAKRAIVEEHSGTATYVYTDDGTPACQTCGDATIRWPCRTLRLLALPFAQYPGYREEWRP